MELFYSVFPWKSFSSNKALKYKWAQGIVTVVYRYSEHHYAFFASLHGKGFKWYGYLMLCVFNPFHAKDLFRYLPKMSENQRFPDVFVFWGGYRNGLRSYLQESNQFTCSKSTIETLGRGVSGKYWLWTSKCQLGRNETLVLYGFKYSL